MPRFPTTEARQGLSTAAGTAPRYSTASPVGDAVRGLGGAIESVGVAFESKEDKLDSYRTNQEYERFKLGQGEALDAEADEADGSRPGLANAALKRYEAASKKFLSTVPKKLRPFYTENLATFGERYSIRAGGKEEAKRHGYYRNSLTESIDRKKLVVSRNPDSAETLIKKYNGEIDATDLPKSERDARKKGALRLLTSMRELARIKSDPSYRDRWTKAFSDRKTKFTGSKKTFVESMMPFAITASKKTGVDPRIIIAQAALESAYGKKAPGNNFFGIKSHGKGGGQSFTTHEVINGKRIKIKDSFRRFSSMGASVAGYADFINKNSRYKRFKGAKGLAEQARALQSSGYATDPTYGAKVLSIARSIGGSDGNGAPLPDPDPEITKTANTLGYKETMRLVREAEGVEKENSARTAALMSVAVSRNELDYSDLDAALNSGDITDSKWAALTKELDRRRKDAGEADAGIAAISDSLKNGTPFDISAKGNKKALDAYYSGPFSKAVEGLDEEAKATATANLVKEIGAVPSSLKSGLKAALLSKSPAQRQQAADMLGRITENSPRLLEAFGGKTFKFGLDAYNRAKLGVPWPRALEMAEQNTFNVDEGTRKARRAALKADKTEEKVVEEVRAKLADEGDSGLFSLDAEVPDELLNEFADLFVSEFEATGSLETATKMAEMGIRKRWAISHANGTGTWMKDAPEAHYSVFNDPKRDGAWIKEQAENELLNALLTKKAKISGDVDGAYKGKRNQDALPTRIKDNLRLMPMPDSHRGKPSYQILVIDKDGVIQSVKRADGSTYEWVPEWASSQEKKRQVRAASDKVRRDNEKMEVAIEDRKDLVKRNAGIAALASERGEFEATMKKIRGE